jgi:glycosyl hydrolase family 99
MSLLNTRYGGATNPVSKTITSASFYGGVRPVYTPADARRLVLAFYYPWYSQTDYDTNPLLTDRPSQPRGTYNVASVYSMTKQAHDAGVDGFIVSWAGQAHSGIGFDAAIKAAEAAGSVVSAMFETPRANPQDDQTLLADPAVVEQWLRELLVYADSPAFLRSDGVPVVFVYLIDKMSPANWASIMSHLAADGLSVKLVGDRIAPQYRNTEWGFYGYNPNRYTTEGLRWFNRSSAADLHLLSSGPKLYASTVSPGLDAHLLRPSDPIVPRGANGEQYAGTWSAALSEASDWVLITSWNEWYESTSIEPSVNYGDLALQQTATFAAQFHGVAP